VPLPLLKIGPSDFQMIRINAIWLAATRIDFDTGTDSALAKVLAVLDHN
jgi:hypothetical protein